MPLIDVADLRVGMYVHLDGSWLSHPFARSSFRIATAEQLAALRSLGCKTLRWSPRYSDTEATLPLPRDRPGAGIEEGGAAASEAAARRMRQESLTAEREALAACEREFGEAVRDCTRLIELAPKDPVASGQRARALAGTMVDKMAGAQDMCIRLLSDGAGDRMSSHAVNVGMLSLLLGKALGWNPSDLLDLGVGALLHDIGKLALPAGARDRASCALDADIRLYEGHVKEGVAAGTRMDLPPAALQVIAEHHELADGSGFPAAIRNDRACVAARIVGLVDRYDNLCNPAAASQAMTPHDALSQIFTKYESKHDMTILGAFIGMLGIYPAGSVVQLTDGRCAMVVAVNSSRSVAPRVLVYDPGVPRDEALFIDLQRKGSLGIRRAVAPSELSPEAFEYLQPRRRLAYHCEPVERTTPN